MKKCPNCEHELIEGLKYCFNCGKEIDSEDKENDNEDVSKPKSRLDTQVLDMFFN